MSEVTAYEVQMAATRANVTWVPHHDCSFCGEWTGYEIQGDAIWYRSACGCSWSPSRPSSWRDAAEFINMQSPEWRQKIKVRFGWPATEADGAGQKGEAT